MAINPSGSGTITVTSFSGLRTDCPATAVDGGHSPACNDVVFAPGLVYTREALQRMLTVPSPYPLVWGQGMTAADGSVHILVLDAQGTFSKVVNGALTPFGSTVAGAQVSAVNAYGRMYMALSDGSRGIDVPRQYDPLTGYFDRVSQDGPGAPPTFVAVQSGSLSYPITGITQPAAQNRASSYFLQSSGPGNSDSGNVVTVYYADSGSSSADADLVAAFNTGNPVYLYFSFTGAAAQQGPYTVLVTGVGEASPPDQPRAFFYFTYSAPSAGSVYYKGSDGPQYVANYQRTLATITATNPVPGITVGSNIAVSGTSVVSYNAQWTVADANNSANLDITETVVSGGVATYSYSVVSGTAPVAGEQITVTGTLNGNGELDVTGATIATASGGEVGTFTINGFAGPDYTASPEDATAISYGTSYSFDPGALVLGRSVSPIYGNSTGGNLLYQNATTVVSPGTRKGCVFFITRTGFTTAPSIVATFTVPESADSIRCDNLPIGPSNVIARGLAFTGANGGKFFYLPVPVLVKGVVYGTSTVINDNTTTSITVQFTNQALLSADAIDIPGNNLLAQVTLEPSLAVTWFGQRMAWWGQRNTISNLINMGFEGGILMGSPNAPLGWTVDGTGGTLVPGDSGLAWQIDGGTGQISQTAYQDSNYVAILQPNTLYSFRLWAKGAATAGTITANLFGNGGVMATATVAVSSVGSGQFYEATFSAETPAVIPADARLQVLAADLTGTVVLDEMSIGYAQNPYRNPIARMSYVENPEAFDGETGVIGPGDDTSALIAVMRSSESTALFVTERAAYYTTEIEDAEPSSWVIPRIGQDCGLEAPNAIVRGKGWVMWAGRDAAQLYTGGVPLSVSNGILPSWQKFTAQWAANDPTLQRVYFGGLTAPAVGSGPSQQTIWMYDYHEGIESGKWSPWTVAAVSADYLATGTVFVAGSNLYSLSDTSQARLGLGPDADDDFGTIASSYVPACFSDSGYRKLFTYLVTRVSGDGTLAVQQYRDGFSGSIKSTRAATLTDAPDTDVEFGLNVSARYLFLRFSPVGRFALSEINVACTPDAMAPVTGWF